MMSTEAQVKEAIKTVFEQQFAPARVVEMQIENDHDHDGDPILRVEIVFDHEDDRLDPNKVKSLLRHLREPLEALHEERFPVVSFRTRDEGPAAAA